MVNFTFAVVEFCDLEVLLQREQHYLDILFSLPANLRYNFSRFAEASFKGLTHSEETLAQMRDSHTGKTHSEETRAKMSDSHTGKTHTPETLVKISEAMSGKVPANAFQTGALNPMYGKVPVSAFQSGPNHPMYGKVAANAMTIYIYSLNGKLINSFSAGGSSCCC